MQAGLETSAARILLLIPSMYSLEVGGSRGFITGQATHDTMSVGRGTAGAVVMERRRLSVAGHAEAEGDPALVSLLKAEGLTEYHAVPLIAKGVVKGVLEVFGREPRTRDSEWFDFLEALAGQAAIAIDNSTLFNDLQRTNLDLALAYDATLEGWVKALDLRDKETEGHTVRVTEMTMRIARNMRMRDEELAHVRRGALLHDIGKLGIPDAILLKEGPLTDEEWVVMRRHTEYAYEWLWPIPFLRPAIHIPYCHHEKWDGTGYPRGLKGEAIPIEARLFAVADVWDALRSDRPYRSAWSEEKVREHIRSLAGTHFDPAIVETFLQLDAGQLGPISSVA